MTSSAVLMASRRNAGGWCAVCCNNNYQNRNLNAGSGGGPGTPSNSDENGREGERQRERAVNSAVEMIISSQDSPRPDWLDSSRVSLYSQSSH